MSSKEPALPPEVAELKAQGNACFQKGDHRNAYRLFTSAIQRAPMSPALFSNRSAVAIKLKRFTDALLDAEKALKLDPDWDKAYGRAGTAQRCLGQYTLAIRSFQRAEALAPSSTSKAEYAQRVADVFADLNALRSVPEKRRSPFMRLEALRSKGHEYGPDSASVRYAYVSTRITEYWKLCQELTTDKELVPKGDAIVSGPPDIWSAIIGLPVAIFDDPDNSFTYPSHLVWKSPYTLISAIRTLFYQTWDIDDPNAVNPNEPDSLIKHVEKVRSERGWEDTAAGKLGAKVLLAGAISLSTLFGVMNEHVAEEYEDAWSMYEVVNLTITAARAKWPDQANDVLASAGIPPTYERALQCRKLLCALQITNKNEWLPEYMDRVERSATANIKMCENHPIPKPDPNSPVSEFVTWLGHDACVRAQAYRALSLLHGTRAEEAQRDEAVNDEFMYLDEPEARLCLENAQQAALWFPRDDPQCALHLWSALEMQMRLGGVTLKVLDENIAAAKKAEVAYERYHGLPTRHETDSKNPAGRDYVMHARERLILKATKRGIKDPKKIALNPIPRFLTNRTEGNIDITPIIRQMEQTELQAERQHAGSSEGNKIWFSLVDLLHE